jgi:hypothetical protein
MLLSEVKKHQPKTIKLKNDIIENIKQKKSNWLYQIAKDLDAPYCTTRHLAYILCNENKLKCEFKIEGKYKRLFLSLSDSYNTLQ